MLPGSREAYFAVASQRKKRTAKALKTMKIPGSPAQSGQIAPTPPRHSLLASPVQYDG